LKLKEEFAKEKIKPKPNSVSDYDHAYQICSYYL